MARRSLTRAPPAFYLPVPFVPMSRTAPHVSSAPPSLAAVRERLARLLHEIARVPHEQIVDGAGIDGDLRMESIDFVELQVAIEDEYGIELDPIRVVELNEFGAIAAYVHDCVAGAP